MIEIDREWYVIDYRAHKFESNKSVIQLCRQLKNQKVDELILDNSFFSELRYIDFLIKRGLRESFITILSLAHIKLSKKDLSTLLTVLQEIPVVELNLSNCGLGDKDMEIIGRFLPLCFGLKRIDLSFNKISNRGVSSLLSYSENSLQILDLASNSKIDEGIYSFLVEKGLGIINLENTAYSKQLSTTLFVSSF